jgi:hypothetical protein
MTYEQRKDLKPGDFKRACGVHPQTFEQMLQVLRENAQKKLNDYRLKLVGCDGRERPFRLKSVRLADESA